jgi:hypothetical protein
VNSAHAVIVKSHVVPLVLRPPGWIWKGANDCAMLAGLPMVFDEKDPHTAQQVRIVF